MIKIVKAEKYSHCSSCGKANKYFCTTAYTPETAKIYKMKFAPKDSKQIRSFGFCKECLKKMNEEINNIMK